MGSKHFALPLTDGAVTVHGTVTDVGQASDGSPVVIITPDLDLARSASKRIAPLTGQATCRQFNTLLRGGSVEAINISYGPQYAGSAGQGPASAYRWYAAMLTRALVAGAGSNFPSKAIDRMVKHGGALALVLNPKRAKAKACIGTPDQVAAWAKRQLPKAKAE